MPNILQCGVATEMLCMIFHKYPLQSCSYQSSRSARAFQGMYCNASVSNAPVRHTAEDLWRLLEDVGIQSGPTARAHPAFGKPEDRIKAMVQKKCAASQSACGSGRLPRLLPAARVVNMLVTPKRGAAARAESWHCADAGISESRRGGAGTRGRRTSGARTPRTRSPGRRSTTSSDR